MLAAQRARPPDDEPESADDEASDEASEDDDSEEELCATTLHAAAYLDRVDDITAMVGSGDFAVDDADDTGASPLHIAAAMGNVDAARALLGLGAPVDARDAEGWTPLHEAAKTGHAAVAAALLAAGADAEALGGAGKAGALHIAAANGHTAVVAECVREVRARAARDGGGDALARLVALRDGDAGATALHHACYSGSVEALRALLGAGASARAVASNGATPMHFAAHGESEAVVAALLAAGAAPLPDRIAWTRPPLELLGFAARFAERPPAVERRARAPDGFASHEVWRFAGEGGDGVLMHAFELARSAALNPALAAEAAAVEREGTGLAVSNVGGFHGNRELLDRDAPCVREFAEALGRAAAALGGDGARVEHAWVNVSRAGDYNRLHDHAPAAWSGAYYVAVPEPPPTPPSAGAEPPAGASLPPPPDARGATSGRLAFRLAADGVAEKSDEPLRGECEYFAVAPREGLLLIFPGTLKHAVLPLEHEGLRISISFNCAAV